MAARRPKVAYRRRLTTPSRYSIKSYAALTAEMLWAWNRLHSTLFDLFTVILGDGPQQREKAYAIWHMFQSDKSQRDMVLQVAQAALPRGSRNVGRIKWLVSVTNKIAQYRNAVVHVPLIFQDRPGRPSAIFLDTEAARDTAKRRLELAGSKERFWNNMAGDLFVLGQFTHGIIFDLKENSQPYGASLQRPKLLSLKRIGEIDSAIAPPQSKPKSKHRRRGSH